ncbi:MAG: MFS transporter, partial [Pseudomonadota bacterium]
LYLSFGVFMAVGINVLSYSPHMAIIPRWFKKKRGLASGLAASGIGIGTLVLVPFNELMIDTLGWRSGFFVLSGVVLCILVPATAIFHRRSPEDIGLYPDGLPPKVEGAVQGLPGKASPAPKAKASWTFGEAFRVRAFWLMVLTVLCDSFVTNTIIVHQAVYLVDRGYSGMLAASLVGLVGLIGSVGGISCGLFSDHFGSKTGYTAGGLLAFMGIIVLLLIKDALSPWMPYVFVILYGLGTGAKQPMIATITGDLFPGNALGRILAAQSVGFGIGGALGAYGGGYFFDHAGSYLIPFLLVLTVLVIAVFSVWTANSPPKAFLHDPP